MHNVRFSVKQMIILINKFKLNGKNVSVAPCNNTHDVTGTFQINLLKGNNLGYSQNSQEGVKVQSHNKFLENVLIKSINGETLNQIYQHHFCCSFQCQSFCHFEDFQTCY